MATTPFTAAFEANLKDSIQGGKLRLLDEVVVDPQFYCCLSGNTVGVDKDPVPHVRVSPTELCAGAPIVTYYNASWSPTGTIATWEVDWGDGNSNNGAWPGAGFVAHPLGGYVAADTYTITLEVTDTIGASASREVQVVVNDCAAKLLPDADLLVATDVGVYRTAFEYGGTMHWELMEGIAYGTAVYDMCEDPQFSQYTVSKSELRVYAAAGDGLYYCDDPFGDGSWIRMVSLVQAQTICTLPTLPITFSSVACCEGLPGYLVATGWDNVPVSANFTLHTYVAPSTNPADYNGRGIGAWTFDFKGALTISRQVDDAGEPLCVVQAHGLRGLALLRHESDTSGPWIWYETGISTRHPHIWSYWEPNEGVLATTDALGVSYVLQAIGMIEWPWAVSTLRVGAAAMVDIDWATHPMRNRLIWSYVDDPALYVVDANNIWIADIGLGYWYAYGPNIIVGDAPQCATGDRTRGFFIANDGSAAPPGTERIVLVTEGNAWTNITGDLIPGPTMGNSILHIIAVED